MNNIEIKFGTDGYDIPNSRFRLTKLKCGSVELAEYDSHSGRLNGGIFIPKEDIQTLIKLLSK
jgi:hypothetical protein